MKKSLIPIISTSLLAAAAYAQPSAVDLGPLSQGQTPYGTTATPGLITWLKFTIPEISSCHGVYLDIYGQGPSFGDTEFGLYDSQGVRVTNDDDDGPGTFSALTFGTPLPQRTYTNAQPGNGRDGFLPAGDYYLAVCEFDTFFDETDWQVFAGSSTIGGTPVTVNFDFLPGTVPTPAPGQFFESLCAGDPAGPLPPTAEPVTGTGPVSRIDGFLRPRDDIDMYRICITDAANFSADTLLVSQWDTQLYLFDAAGHGVTYSDDADDSLQSHITSSVVSTLGNGTYYLAVASYGKRPVDGDGNDLWDTSLGTNERLPDGLGAANPVAHWAGDVYSDAGAYPIILSGATFCPAAPPCGTADFDGDGDTGTDADIEAFFACLAGNCCATCFPGGADFNADGDTGTDADIESFFRVLGGGVC